MFFGLITSSVASETSDVLVDATASFAVTIQQQFEMLVGDPAAAELAKKTIDYATAKTAYFYALRAEVSDLIDIATSNETRPSWGGYFRSSIPWSPAKNGKRWRKPLRLFSTADPLVCRSSPLPQRIVKLLWGKPFSKSSRAPPYEARRHALSQTNL